MKMEKQIMITLGIALVIIAFAGGFVEIQTAYEELPLSQTKNVIASRVVWPWYERWSTSWVPARSSQYSVRTIQTFRGYGLLPEPTTKGGLILDNLELLMAVPKAKGMD